MNGYMWRIRSHTERKYTPQGGSIPLILLPGVASYRRQPRAIKSTTPVGLPYHHPLTTTPQPGDSAHHGHLLSRHNMGCDHTIPWGYVPRGHPSPRHSIEMVHGIPIFVNA